MMLPRIAQLLLGDSWRTSLAAIAAATVYGAQSVPCILDGTATPADYRRAAFAATLFLVGRFSADNKKPAEKKEETQQ